MALHARILVALGLLLGLVVLALFVLAGDQQNWLSVADCDAHPSLGAQKQSTGQALAAAEAQVAKATAELREEAVRREAAESVSEAATGTPIGSEDEPSTPVSTETSPRQRRAQRTMVSPQHVQRIWVMQEEQKSFKAGMLDAQLTTMEDVERGAALIIEQAKLQQKLDVVQ